MPQDRVLLVSCSKSKRACNNKYKAEDLYNSALFKKSRLYAQSNFSHWYILSAKHGLLSPGNLIKPYNLTLNDMTVTERKAWSASVSLDIFKSCTPETEFDILAGNSYTKYLVPLLCERGYTVRLPLKGLGIGQRLAWLNNRILHE